MTPDEFTAARQRLGLSLTRFCARLGIAKNTGTGYALGRHPIPRYIPLAIAALEAGLEPVTGSSPDPDRPD